jgi:hypothetical protein
MNGERYDGVDHFGGGTIGKEFWSMYYGTYHTLYKYKYLSIGGYDYECDQGLRTP